MYQHIKDDKTVLSHLQPHQLYVKLEKCEFPTHKTAFLGYIISYQEVEMDNSKVQAVLPQTVKELCHKFICNFSHTAALLTSVLKGKPAKLKWNEAALKSFENLKTIFTTAPVLKQPEPDLPFIVEVDTFDCGIGAVFSQHHGNPGKLHPCALFSRKLCDAEKNYDVGKKELLSTKAGMAPLARRIHSSFQSHNQLQDPGIHQRG